MLINGTNFKVLPDFVPEMRLALAWSQMDNKNWYAIDRLAACDQYASTLKFYGQEDAINSLINQIDTNRTAESNILALSGFNSSEKVFGADIDYTGTINATVETSHPYRRIQGTWKGWGLTMRLRALSPGFLAITPALPPLTLIGVGVDADADLTLNTSFSYSNSPAFADHASDYGTFTGTFTFTDSEMARLRRFQASNRATTVTIPKLYGVKYPFGPRSPHTANPTNFSAKIISLTSEKVYGIDRWMCQLTITENFV